VLRSVLQKFSRIELVLFGFGLTGFLISIVSLSKAGFGWDATFHTVSAKFMRQVHSGMSLQEAYDLIPYTDEFYGVLLHWLADILHWIFTGNPPLDSENYLAYYWQGTVNFIFLIFATLACAFAVAKVLQQRLYFFVVWAVLGLTPIWIGTGHTDFKDLPVAAGITILSSGLILALSELVAASTKSVRSREKSNKPSIKYRKRSSAIKVPKRDLRFSPITLFISLGTFISLGSRAGSIAIVCVVFAASVLSGLLIHKLHQGAANNFVSFLKTISFSFLMGLVFLLILNPIARINLPMWLIDSVQIANKYPWVGPVRTAGQQLMSDDLPWWYIPSWYLVSLPTIFLVLSLAAIGVFIYCSFFDRNRDNVIKFLIFMPFIGQGLFVPVIMNLSGTILYDGIRHVLFAIPALIILTIVTFSVVLHAGSKLKKHSGLTFIILLISLSLTLFEVSRWVPYEYAHKNVLHKIGSKDINWEMDYWGVSAREGAERLLNQYGLSEAIILPSGEMASAFGASSITSIEGDQITLAGDHKIDRYFGVYLFNRFTWSETADLPLNDCKDAPLAKCNQMIPPKCKILFQVIHAGVILGKGAVCQDPSIKEDPDFSSFRQQ